MTAASTLLLAVGIAVLLSALLCHLPGPRAMPSPDRWHRTVTPVTGGIALFGAFVIALQPAFLSGAVDRRYALVLLGAAAAFGVGLWDDWKSIGARRKFGAQLAIGVTAASAGDSQCRPRWLSRWTAGCLQSASPARMREPPGVGRSRDA